MAYYTIQNQGSSVKSFPDSDHPAVGTVVVNDNHSAAFEKWEINMSGNPTTIVNHATLMYAYGENSEVITVSDEGIPPSSLNWDVVPIASGVYGIRASGTTGYWTVTNDGQIILSAWSQSPTQLFSIESVA